MTIKVTKPIDYTKLSDKKLDKIVDKNYSHYFCDIPVNIMNLCQLNRDVIRDLKDGLTLDTAFQNAINTYGEK